MNQRLGVAVIGMGGFAGVHHGALRALEAEGVVRLIATCDLAPEKFPDLLAKYEESGVRVYRDYLEMLDAHRNELDFVTIPTPIPVHAAQHRACVDRGLAAYLEKPPTLDYRELRAMEAVDARGRFATQIGFNFIVEDARQNLKGRLLAGEFGQLERAAFLGFWPRSTAYFERAAWAGKLRLGGRLVLDSCAGNAMAHYVHNLLFWCGSDEYLSWGEVELVEAELYRAHAIESFDTVFARGRCGGVEFRIGATHAGEGGSWQSEHLECELASLTYLTHGGGYKIRWKDGRTESGATDPDSTEDLLRRNLAHYASCLRGEQPRPLTTLADSRPFVTLNDLLFVAAGRISTVAGPALNREVTERGDTFLAIRDVESLLRDFAASGQFPSETGVPWAEPGGSAGPERLEQLDATIDNLLGAPRCA